MENKAQPKRTLRTNNTCNPVDNMFKHPLYLQQVSYHIPEQILSSLSNLAHLSCQEIDKLTFDTKQHPRVSLKTMEQALRAQKEQLQRLVGPKENKRNKYSDVQSLTGPKSNKLNHHEFIKSEQPFLYEQEISNNQIFKPFEHVLE